MHTIHMLLAVMLAVVLAAGSASAAEGIFNVREFGALDGRDTYDGAAIQAAVDACAEAGGGTVYFPAGDYLSGTIHLRSEVTVHLDGGATLWASTGPAHYNDGKTRHLFLAEDAEHITVRGAGIIHGQGTADLGRRPGGTRERPAFRTGILLFEQCRHVAVRGVTILYSDAWTLHFRRCETVFVDGVTILNNFWRVNSDGIDPNSCRDVHISNCHIVAGDDCIVLKATEPYPCENVVVTNCTLESIATALKLGTESHGDFRNVHFSNCTIRNTSVGIGFYLKDGATMERVSFADISIESANPVEVNHVIYPIFMDIEKRHADSKVGRIRDVTFRGIQVESGSGILIQGMPESPIENLTIDGLSFRVPRADSYDGRRKAVGGRRTTKDERDYVYAQHPAYVTLAHVKGLALDNVRVTVEERALDKEARSAVSGNALEHATLRAVTGSPAEASGELPVVALHDCSSALVTGCIAEPGTGLFLGLSGETAGIELAGNHLSGAKQAEARLEADRE